MFKLKNMSDNDTLENTKKEVKNRLEALPGKINVIRSMEVGINILTSGRAFDVALVSSFENLDDLETYRVHPAHQEVVKFIGSIKETSASVDFVI